MNYLLFDDDCGICTKFAKQISRFTKLRTVPMHNPTALSLGYERIGENEYWQSFHIIENGKWYTNSEAIINLSKHFPLGKLIHHVVKIPVVLWSLTKFLEQMKIRRKLECKVSVGDEYHD